MTTKENEKIPDSKKSMHGYILTLNVKWIPHERYNSVSQKIVIIHSGPMTVNFVLVWLLEFENDLCQSVELS